MIATVCRPIRCVFWTVAVLWAALAAGQLENDPFQTNADWEAPQVANIRTGALEWLNDHDPDEGLQTLFNQMWDEELPLEEAVLLERLARTFALVNPHAAELVELCLTPRVQPVPPSASWLKAPDLSAFESHNLRLLFGRWLIHEAMYDEALEQIADLEPHDVVAPAALLFYQGAAYYSLLEKEKGLAVLDRLVDGEEYSPRRYVVVARLMRDDLQTVQPDTLDHIARRMRDIRRRLDLGRAGEKVRRIEDGVIESLDKLIKEMEEQQQQQQAAAAGAGGSQSSSPAPDSRIMGGKGPGEVERKDIGSGSGWGSLPPKEREEALQQIGRDFPSHYRDVIEEYFRRKAAAEDTP